MSWTPLSCLPSAAVMKMIDIIISCIIHIPAKISKRFIMSICRWFSTVKAVKGATSQEFTNIFLCFIAAAGDEITPVLTLLLPRPIPSSTAAIQFKVYLTSMQNKCLLSASGNSGSSQWSSFHNQNPSTYTLSGAPQPVNAFYKVLVIFIFNVQSKKILLN